MENLIINTGEITQPFRSLGLMHVLDKFKFHYQRMKNKEPNRLFKKNNPGIVLPPDYMLFEAFNLNYDKYYFDGQETASWLIDSLSPHVRLTNNKILDWGCGPARIVRHLPGLLPGCEIHATDYNKKTIEWCADHIPLVHFSHNDLSPPLKYADYFFDIIYGISILTHLSGPNHQAWLNELMRILVPEGILLLTTHGRAFKEKMTKQENEAFDDSKLVVRDKAKEGHRVFAAFHPPAFMMRLFEEQCTILEHREGTKKEWGIEQDTWILKKK